MKIHMPLNTKRPEEEDGNPILTLSDIFLELGSLPELPSIILMVWGYRCTCCSLRLLIRILGPQLYVYKTSALTPNPSFQSLNLNLISHDAYETNITKLHTDLYRNYDTPQPQAVVGKI